MTDEGDLYFSLRDLGRRQPLRPADGPGRAPEEGGGAPGAPPELVPREAGSLQERLNLRQYWHVVWGFKWIVLGITAVIVAVAVHWTNRLPDVFRARATLIQKGGGETHVLPGGSVDYGYRPIESISAIVRTHRVMELAVAYLQEGEERIQTFAVGDDPEQWREVPPEDIRFCLALDADQLMGMVGAVPQDQGDLLYISAQGGHRYAVAAVANAVVEAFLARTVELQREVSGTEETYLEEVIYRKNEEIVDLDRAIIEAQRELTKGGRGVDVLSLEQRLEFDTLLRHQFHLEQERIQLQAQEIQIASLERRIAGEPEQVVVESTFEHPLRGRLSELRIERERLLSRYTERHPKLLKVDEEIAKTERGLEVETEGPVGREVRGPNPVRKEMETELSRARVQEEVHLARVAALEAVVREKEAQLRDIPEAVVRLEQLRNRKEIGIKVVSLLEEKRDSASFSRVAVLAKFQVVEEARPPATAFAPDRQRNYSAAVLVGLFFGIVAAFLLEAIDNTVKTPEALRTEFGLVPLGIIPRWRKDEVYIEPDAPKSAISEVFGLLRNNIRHASRSRPERRLLIASALQGEGKSTVAVNLAVSYALEGSRTILVNLDLRKAPRPELLAILGFPGDPEIGMADYLEDRVQLRDILHRTHVDGLHYVSPGRRVHNPARLLRSLRAAETLDLLEENTDVLIIDAPAVLPVVDASLLATHVRGIIVVVACGETLVGAARQATDRLRHMNAPVIGAVLNKVRGVSSEHFYYYSRYVYK